MPGILKNIAYQIVSPKSSARAYYKSFRKLLKTDQLAHEYLAELQEIQQQPLQRDFSYIINLYKKLARSVFNMIGCLKQLSPKAATHLQGCYEKINFPCRFALTRPEIISVPPFLLPLKAGYVADCLIGGKAFHLAQLAVELNMPVPGGFVISTSTYNYFLDYNKLRPQINSLLQPLYRVLLTLLPNLFWSPQFQKR